MKIVTSATVFNEALGMRLSFSYSEVDENGDVSKDNVRQDKVITDTKQKKVLQQALDIAQTFIENEEDQKNGQTYNSSKG